MIQNARIIPLDGRLHLNGKVDQWEGDPRGRWEGNTLLIESTNFQGGRQPAVAERSRDANLKSKSLCNLKTEV